MVIKFYYRIFVLVILVISSCFKSSQDSDWTIEWAFKNKVDSLPLFVLDSFELGNSLSETIRNGQIDSAGHLLIHIIVPGLKEDVINKNPKLRCRVYNNNETLFDSTFVWKNMEFSNQYSEFYREISDNVSKKTLFLNK